MKIIIVEARFYPEIADGLLEGAKNAILSEGYECEVISVSGALEIAQAISIYEEKHPHFAFVALGCIIRGETYHFEVVSNESARALTDLSVDRKIIIGNGILTCENKQQAVDRAGAMDKGGFAARAAIELIKIKERYGR